MKRFTVLAAGLVAAFALTAGTATAAPTAASTVTITPQGKLYKDVKEPVNITFRAQITPGAGETTHDPLMNAKYTLTKDLAFVPRPSMPVCTQITDMNANFPPETAKAICPDSIVGDGTAELYFAQNVESLITDPVITIFNGGKTNSGEGILTIQAWSNTTNTGIFMTGQIKNGVLDVAIPRLPGDSAVPTFVLSIPGEIGLDKTYAEASCSTGSYSTTADFTLGKRSDANVVSDQSVIKTPLTKQTCKGLAGKPKFSKMKVKGPKAVKSGKKGTFKVTVTNKGTGSSKKGKVTASGGGKGKAKLPVIKPGKSKTVKVKVKVKGKKGKKTTLKFKATGGASASGKLSVKVK